MVTLWASLSVVLTAGPLHAAPPSRPKVTRVPPPQAPTPELVANERRAVRGSAVPTPQEESAELQEVRRFERAAFEKSEAPALPVDADAEGQPRRTVGGGQPTPSGADKDLPPALRGLWSGSGDGPEELRSPPMRRRPSAPPDSGFLRSLTLPDIPVRWEASVLRFLDYFKNDPKGRTTLSNLMRRMGRYHARFERILTENGAPKDLVYLAMMESGFQSRATSNKAAGGFWQFMPTVAPAYGLEVNNWVDGRRDFDRATAAAARYLLDLQHRFGSWPLAFAAFHAGYGNILNSISRFNSNDYWELCKHEAGLPFETTTYVPKILAAAIIGHNREAFGFDDVIPDPPVEFEEVEVPAGTLLASVARAVGSPVDVVADLNPALLKLRTPPDKGPMKVRVPPGTAAAWNSGSRTDDKYEVYVLKFGEALDDVARARGVSVRELKRINGLKDSAEVRGGITILVPPPGLALIPPPAKNGTLADDAVLVAVPENIEIPRDRERVFYRAREGDTLDELAGRFAVAVDDVVDWNNLDPDARLHPKMVLQLFVKKGFDRAGVLLLDESRLHIVTLGSEGFHALEVARRGKSRLSYAARPGDTLSKIAKRYGLEPADLARINRLSANAELSDGQKVIVYTPTPDLPREVAGRSPPTRRPEPPAATRGNAPRGSAPTTRSAVPAPSAPKPGLKVPGGRSVAPIPRGGALDARARSAQQQGRSVVAQRPHLPALSSVRKIELASKPAPSTKPTQKPVSTSAKAPPGKKISRKP